VTAEERGIGRCPRCGAGEWERGPEHVVVAPLTGETVTFELADDGEQTWHCSACHLEVTAAAFIDQLAGEVASGRK
jgi:hypothetical protein